MRLLDAHSCRFEVFFEPDIPPYAILSHRWGPANEEVSFTDVETRTMRKKTAFEKIRRTCDQAIADGYNFIWVDTCCIEKNSSSELSESINSMFRWYRNAAVCYVFMNDVDKSLLEIHPFHDSMWFKRGWTLQELIAPDKAIFYDRHWRSLGTRDALRQEIAGVTKIPEELLQDDRTQLEDALQFCTIAQRMSWAALRKTTRIEDRAYSLIGLFGISMPLLYGEGQRAFTRLQEEILRSSSDLSILAWDRTRQDYHDPNARHPILASSPDEFADSSYVLFAPTNVHQFDHTTITMTNAGLRIEPPNIIHSLAESTEREFALSLECRDACDITKVKALKLRPLDFSILDNADKKETVENQREIICYVANPKFSLSPLFSTDYSRSRISHQWSSLTISRGFRVLRSVYQSPMARNLLIPDIHTHIWLKLPTQEICIVETYHPERWHSEKLRNSENPEFPRSSWTNDVPSWWENHEIIRSMAAPEDLTFQFDLRVPEDSGLFTADEQWSYGAITFSIKDDMGKKVEDLPFEPVSSFSTFTLSFARKISPTLSSPKSEVYVQLSHKPDNHELGDNRSFIRGHNLPTLKNDEYQSLSYGTHRLVLVKTTVYRLGLCIGLLELHIESEELGSSSPMSVGRDAAEENLPKHSL